MKKYLPLIEAMNAICWFWFDFSWMQEWMALAKIGSMLAMATAVLAFAISWSWSSCALMWWVIMNSFWMMEYDTLATDCGFIGFAMIVMSIVDDGNIKDFVRLKIKK